MKQHITKEPWDELSKKAQASILIKIKFIVPTTICDGLTGFEYMFIGIGQMIEFLGEEWEHKVGTMEYGSYYERGDCPLPDSKELCDALWDTVKLDLVEEEQADITGIAQEDLKRGDVVTFDIKTGKINKILYGEET